MEPNSLLNGGSQPRPTPPPVQLTASPAPSTGSKATTLMPVAPGFEVSSVRCAKEAHLRELICTDEGLQCRMKALAQQREEARVRMRVQLMTDGYRVDQAITPRLYNLGRMLIQVLRLVQPLDLFVQGSQEHNAFCLPSRKGNRLVMCLNSGLIASLSPQELLFVMGHEVGHALLRHGETLGIAFDDPRFSPLEVVRLRALERAQEISCDRFGLLACQDVRVASSALFKITSGLPDKWISFDETAYSRHFDDISSMAEVVDLEDASRTHPFIPLRVKALIAFAKSELYAKMFNRAGWSIDSGDMERGVETMLSVLAPDLTELENANEKEAFGRFLMGGAQLVIAADGVIEPQEVAWLQRFTEDKLSGEELAANLSRPEFRQELKERLEESAHILRNKLPEQTRAGLLHAMCEVALSAGGMPQAEFDILDALRRTLHIRMEIAQDVLEAARNSQDEGTDEASAEQGPGAGADSTADPITAILERANLPEGTLAQVAEICNAIRSQGMPFPVAARALVSWAITASCKKGPISAAQAKKLAVSAVKVCRELQPAAGGARKGKATPIDKQIRESGLVSLFQKGEKVTHVQTDKQYVVVSVLRRLGKLKIAPVDNPSAVEQVEPHDLRKDPIEGAWPAEFAD